MIALGWVAAMISAAGAYQAALERHLAAMSPDERTEYLRRHHEERLRTRYDSSPEVEAARNHPDDLSPESREALIEYARRLAADRIQADIPQASSSGLDPW